MAMLSDKGELRSRQKENPAQGRKQECGSSLHLKPLHRGLCLPAKAKAIHPTAFGPKHLFAGAPNREAHFPVLGVQM